MSRNAIPQGKNKEILAKIATAYSDCAPDLLAALDSGNATRLNKLLKLLPIKQLTYTLIWTFNLDIPTGMRKQMLCEYLATNWAPCHSMQARFSFPEGFHDESTISFYHGLAKAYGATWLDNVVDMSKNHFIPYEDMVFHSSLTKEFSPFYTVAAHLGLYKLSNDESKSTITYDLPEKIRDILNKHPQARIILYAFFESISKSRQPFISPVVWENVHDAKFFFVNGFKVGLTEGLAQSYLVRREDPISHPRILPNAVDITAAMREFPIDELSHVYIDLSTSPLPPHPDAKGDPQARMEYRSPYVSLYLAKRQSIDTLRSQIASHQYLATPKSLEALRSVADTPAFKLACGSLKRISTISSRTAVAEDEDEVSDIEIIDEIIYLRSHLTMQRIVTPVRGESCRHFNRVMDLGEYLSHCSKTNLWNCTVCNEPAGFRQLHFDAYINYLLCINPKLPDTVKIDPSTGLPFAGQQITEEKTDNSAESGWSSYASD